MSSHTPSPQSNEDPSLSRRQLLECAAAALPLILLAAAKTVYDFRSITDETNTPREHADARVNELRKMFFRILEIETDMHSADDVGKAALQTELSKINVDFQAYRASDAAPLPVQGRHFVHGILQAQQRIKWQTERQ